MLESNSDYCAFQQSTRYHMAGQIIVHSTSQHGTTWLARSSCILPVNMVPHGWSDHRAFYQSTRYHMVGQIIVHSPSQHGITWLVRSRAFYQSSRYHMVGHITVHSTSQHSTTWLVRSKACEERGGTQYSAKDPLSYKVARLRHCWFPPGKETRIFCGKFSI